ncbi:hypothetical protein [Microbacterium sp. VKM Ac-2923]|uniref:hypothetical protein n=1 Tax=Microbacterium sp. VKM Ac-2923 TaxID=2929476 RepID=UPI001FB249EF|nr:hypothetical protein [Microbacterium sp. VKM Ac-2923]MCJ1708919.1 hypothetical protein [Microbacterium sp. VKM Ac-2923]
MGTPRRASRGAGIIVGIGPAMRADTTAFASWAPLVEAPEIAARRTPHNGGRAPDSPSGMPWSRRVAEASADVLGGVADDTAGRPSPE